MAKRFTFRLQTLLELREQEQRQQQRQLAAILDQHQACQASIRSNQQRIVAENQVLRKKELTGALNLHYLAAHRRFLGNLQRRIYEELQNLVGIELQAQRARQQLLGASRKKRVLEKLKQRRVRSYQQAVNRAEIQAADELSLQQYARGSHRSL